MNFNEHLKRIRIKKNKTQQDLAEYLNITVQSVSKWEKGTAYPSVEFLPKIAEYYNCSVNAFFSEYELQLYEQFEPLSLKNQLLLYEAILISHGRLIVDQGKKDLPPDELDPAQTIPLDALFLPALYDFLQDNSYVSISRLQKTLHIGYDLSCQIVHALDAMGIIDNSDPNKRGRIIKEKVDLILPYIKK